MTKPIGFDECSPEACVWDLCCKPPTDLQRLMFPACSERVSPQSLGFPGLSPSCSHILTLFQIMRLFLLYSKNPLKDSNLRCSFVRDEWSVKSPTYPRSAVLSFLIWIVLCTVACITVTSVQHIAAHSGVAKVLAKI